MWQSARMKMNISWVIGWLQHVKTIKYDIIVNVKWTNIFKGFLNIATKNPLFWNPVRWNRENRMLKNSLLCEQWVETKLCITLTAIPKLIVSKVFSLIFVIMFTRSSTFIQLLSVPLRICYSSLVFRKITWYDKDICNYFSFHLDFCACKNMSKYY